MELSEELQKEIKDVFSDLRNETKDHIDNAEILLRIMVGRVEQLEKALEAAYAEHERLAKIIDDLEGEWE